MNDRRDEDSDRHAELPSMPRRRPWSTPVVIRATVEGTQNTSPPPALDGTGNYTPS